MTRPAAEPEPTTAQSGRDARPTGASLPRISEGGRRLLRACVIELDERINLQVAAVLAHPAFQQLERTYRSLRLVCDAVGHAVAEGRRSGNSRVGVSLKVLDVTAEEVLRDIQSARSRQKTLVFRHLYRGLDRPKGEPVGLILVAFELDGDELRSADLGPVELQEYCEYFAWLGSECLAPVVMGVAPEFLSFESFDEMARIRPERLVHRRQLRASWLDRLRRSEEARFLVLTLPRVLLRGPYPAPLREDCGYGFRHTHLRSALRPKELEDPRSAASALGDDRHLFGSAAFPLAMVVARSFAFSNWFTYIRGVECGDDWLPDGGGVFGGACAEEFGADSPEVAFKPGVDAVLAEGTEERLGSLGFAVLSAVATRGWTAFHSVPSFREIDLHGRGPNVVAERLGAMTQYLLCACRVAHLAHRYGQSLVGSYRTPEDIEREMHQWLAEHQVENPDTGSPLLLKRPLRSFKAEVRLDPEDHGRLLLDIWLQPHSQFSNATAQLHLVSSISQAAQTPGGPAGGGR